MLGFKLICQGLEYGSSLYWYKLIDSVSLLFFCFCKWMKYTAFTMWGIFQYDHTPRFSCIIFVTFFRCHITKIQAAWWLTFILSGCVYIYSIHQFLLNMFVCSCMFLPPPQTSDVSYSPSLAEACECTFLWYIYICLDGTCTYALSFEPRLECINKCWCFMTPRIH